MRYGAAITRQFTRQVRGFSGENSGSFAILTAMVLAVLTLSAGFAVNLAQLYNAKSNLRYALDAAVTSTARDITTGKIKSEEAREWVERFLKANGDGAVIRDDNLVLDGFDLDKTARTITANAYVDVDLYFPLFGMPNERRVRNAAAAVYVDKKIEIAMMLDVTGSMKKQGKKDKIGDLKDAAKNAVNALLQSQDPKNPRVRVALVPYASGVNVGGLADNLYAEKAGKPDLPPLAGDPIFGGKKDDPLPTFSKYLAAVKKEFPKGDNCATERKDKNGKADFTDDGPSTVRVDKSGKEYYALVNRDNNLGGKECPEAKVIPLTADSTSLLNSIGKFEADGYTAGAIAIQWTYYMLSEKWSDAIKSAGLGDGPVKYNASKVSKVAILMTDGEFNTVFAGVGGSFNNQGSEARQNAETICKNMKKDGIEIYTIGFDISSSEKNEAKAVLQKCASPDMSSIKHYYEASTGAELDAAFQSIIRNTERVMLTQ